MPAVIFHLLFSYCVLKAKLGKNPPFAANKTLWDAAGHHAQEMLCAKVYHEIQVTSLWADEEP